MPSDTPGGRTPPRRFALVLAIVPLLAILIADLALVGHRQGEPTPHPAASRPTTTAQADPIRARATAIRALLHARSHAVLHHDLREWMSVLDPGATAFRRKERREFRNLRKVPFASWSYDFSDGRDRTVSRSYGAPAWAPAVFALHYRLRGFDKRATSLQQFPTFVHRATGWYLARLADRRKVVHDLWDFGPVDVVRTDDVLVLGHPESLPLMQSLAVEVGAAIPRVTAVWGRDWARRAVVLVPSTQHELARVVSDYGSLDNIAAVATAEVRPGRGRPDPVGDRVGINPANWSKLSPLGRRIVLTHELTHVASRRVTSAATPKWLAEGFADYVGYLDSGVPTAFVAQELRRDVLSGRQPLTLPRDSQFDGDSERLSQAYEESWLACRLIALRYGQHALVRFYSAVGRSHRPPKQAVAHAFARVLHTSTRPFLAQWRGYVRSELG